MAWSSSGSESRLSSRPSPSPAPSSTASSVASTIDASAPPSATAAEKTPDEGSKLKTFLSILRKFIGVADIATVRFSLPAQLLEPTPNLEYWNYLDRPETFVSMGDSDDDLGRMLEVLRFWFTKDLKYVKGKPCKPYNSALGEFFRCNWEVADTAPSIRISKDSKSSLSTDVSESSKQSSEPVKVSYLTEQTSHHPPVSAFYVDCPAKGITARGFDQISAKFTGTSIRVMPGAHNLGIFVSLQNRDNEEYQLTHPAANLGGLLRGSLAVTVADVCFVTCPKTKLKAILHYLEEGWLGRTQNKVQGVIFKYDPNNDTKTRLKDVPEKDIVAKIEGCWQEQVFYTLTGSSEPKLLIDLVPLFPAQKLVPPEEVQLPNESRRFWHDVTNAINTKQYGQATKLKHDLEERQREKAAERKANNVEWKPRFFTGAVTPLGKPDLSDEGVQALKGLHEGNFTLEKSEVTGA